MYCCVEQRRSIHSPCGERFTMTHLGEKSFLPEFHGRLVSGRKDATARTVKWGNPGDTFMHAGMKFRLDWVILRRLSQVAHLHFWEEGFDSPEGFINVWKHIHRRMGYDPDLEVWFHSFTRIYETQISQVHHCYLGRKSHRAYVHSNIGANILWCPTHGILATMSMATRKVKEKKGRGLPGERQLTYAQYKRFARRSRK